MMLMSQMLSECRTVTMINPSIVKFGPDDSGGIPQGDIRYGADKESDEGQGSVGTGGESTNDNKFMLSKDLK